MRHILALLALGTGVLLLLVPLLVPARATNRPTCDDNLRHIGLAIGMYRQETGRPCGALESLVPGYLKAVPSCPQAGGRPNAYRAEGGRFTLYCSGWNHRREGRPPDFPLYDSSRGLLRRPGEPYVPPMR